MTLKSCDGGTIPPLSSHELSRKQRGRVPVARIPPGDRLSEESRMRNGGEDGLRVLLAEDESLAALVVEDALTDMGHAVVHAADGEAALHLAGTAPFDVLVTDIAMPRMTGLELIPQLRARHPGLPVVVMTGYLPPD